MLCEVLPELSMICTAFTI